MRTPHNHTSRAGGEEQRSGEVNNALATLRRVTQTRLGKASKMGHKIFAFLSTCGYAANALLEARLEKNRVPVKFD